MSGSDGGATGEAVTVLLVEDNDVDRENVIRAFRRHNLESSLVEARDGLDALAILRGDEGRPPLRKPYLLLLDLALPRLDGLSVLRELRADPALAGTVVFVLTTSSHDQDKQSSYHQHVAGYIVKGEAGPGMVGLVDLLRAYIDVVRLPTQAS